MEPNEITKLLAAKLAIAEAATAGPWESDGGSPIMIQSRGDLWKYQNFAHEEPQMLPSWVANIGSSYTPEEKARVTGNAAFIADARTTMPPLIRALMLVADESKTWGCNHPSDETGAGGCDGEDCKMCWTAVILADLARELEGECK